MKKAFLIFMLAAVCLGGSATFIRADTTADTTNATDTADATDTTEDLKASIAQKEQQIAQLEQEAQQYRQSIAQTTSQTQTLKNQIANINKQIKNLQYNISITQAKLDATQLKIKDLNNNIAATETTVAKNQQLITQLLQNLNELDAQNQLVTLFKVDKLSDFFGALADIDSMQETLVAKINFLKVLKENLKTDLDKSQRMKSQYDSLKTSLGAQKDITTDQKQEKSTLLQTTKNQEQTYQKLLNQTLAKQQQIEKEINDIETILRQGINYGSLPSKGTHIFIIPVQGGRLTQGYGTVPKNSITRKYYSFHNGIDYGSNLGIGAPIYAAADGFIQAIGNNGTYAYGKWIAIRHTNGLTTLYGHLSYVGVKISQQVSQGDTIGYMGKTGLALGPHVHFTVYTTDSFKTESRWYGLLPVGASIDPGDYM
ncbi:MAG: hypothetical protein COV41_03125 [Candidatus Brennerbacteria bacterium CG11_big_fil_rev_8_21_14_0_20_43_10]|uniref:M23ase beta-sheet core domain-containing protein n=1 Tax=Candidatus Brennerbacteria bacterium CG11_big_fil_rev_8_21_14_0_20_43_10 TaxID=1974523 RepID=A0A2H0PTE8_9BACT|nr:MAG: hypothetical protein COV41_03125 [Candidatus Brennerbacteria bacterium CG11_big_fil_rev_8_21_14_0_20_43_10]